MAIEATDLVTTVLLAGGLMGMLGQGLRSAIGLKKLKDSTGDNGSLFSASFSASRFYTSLFIGFLAGALTAFFMSEPTMKLTLSKEVLIGLMAAGYAGTDTLEGLANKFIPGSAQAR
ncbi:hypothetical protein [Roseibium sp. Sym1]|uniref:hypothetical protein n=1 Tax=Roseibium sp. Sym1 TaxID=3016006 RepID=UPI0022B3267F|nr:hypothetical protein [Roseibium sp. Sym1]